MENTRVADFNWQKLERHSQNREGWSTLVPEVFLDFFSLLEKNLWDLGRDGETFFLGPMPPYPHVVKGLKTRLQNGESKIIRFCV